MEPAAEPNLAGTHRANTAPAFLEAFWAAQNFLPDKTPLGDVGSGAGFPGLAMKLYRPSLQVTLIEKSYKKVVFLREVSGKLGLEVDVFSRQG